MSIPSSQLGVYQWEWNYQGQVFGLVKDEGEQDWLPNPYQAQADAQVRAGAWPGASLLIGTQELGDQSPWQHTDGMHQHPELLQVPSDAFTWLSMSPEIGSLDNILHDFEYSSKSQYPFGIGTFEHNNDTKDNKGDESAEDLSTSTGNNNIYDSTDEGDFDADAHDSSPNSGEHSSEIMTADNPSGRAVRKLSHQCVPKTTDFVKKFGDEIERDNVTTLMIRNIPNMYTRSMLMEELDSLGFVSEYDFIYVPIDKSTQWNVGYAFVNFTTPQVAMRCVQVMTNYTFCRFDHGSGKVAQISVAYIQGLERNLEYYSNTAVQCAHIQTHRPLVLSQRQQDNLEHHSRKSYRRSRRMRVVDAQGMHQRAPRSQRQFPCYNNMKEDNAGYTWEQFNDYDYGLAGLHHGCVPN